MGHSITRTIQQIKLGRILAIIRGNYPTGKLLEIVDALLAAPVPAMEITLNSPGALELLPLLRDRASQNMLVGAGTVRTAEQARRALDAGAQFLVSPGFVAAVAQTAQTAGVLLIPGVFTPTEVETARAAGCTMVKLFPANTGGPDHLRALRAPLDDVDFVPTGGIGAANLAGYVRAGAAAVGVGSSLVPGPDASMAQIIANARTLHAVWAQAAGQ